MKMFFPEFSKFTSKVAFYAIPNNGAFCIYNHLGSANVIKENEREIRLNMKSNLYCDSLPYFCLTPQDFEKYVQSISISDYFSFCVVRDPWDRALSMYRSSLSDPLNTLNLKGKSFLDFCQLIKEKSEEKDFVFSFKQKDWVRYLNKPALLLRFEDLRCEFQKMVEENNIVNVSPNLPYSGKKKRSHYSNYFNSESKKIISHIFEEDIDAFKYSFIKKDPGSLKPTGSGGFLRI